MGTAHHVAVEKRTRTAQKPDRASQTQATGLPVPARMAALTYQGAGLAPQALSAADLRALQRTIGNSAVNQLLREGGPWVTRAQAPAPSPAIQRNGDENLQSVGAVSLDLAGQDVARAAIFAAVLPTYGYKLVRQISLDLPAAFTSTERAEMIMQFIVRAGRTTELARYALRTCPDDNQALLGLLTFLQRLQEALHEETLLIAQVDLIATYRADLRDNAPALERVIKIVKGAESVEEARRHIELFKDFNYDPAFAMVAIVGAEEHALDVRQERLRAIAEDEAARTTTAIDARRQEAIASLTRKEREQFAKGLGLGTLEPKVKAHQERLAAQQLGAIEAEAKEQRHDVEHVQGPAAYATRREEYRQFYQAVAYHPAALGALDVAEDDFDVARAIVAAIQAAPRTQALYVDLEPKLAADARTRCLTVPAGEVSAILATLSAHEVAQFAASDHRLALLRQLHASGIAAPTRKALVPRLAQYDAYCATATAAGHLTTLLQRDTPAEILDLLAAVPASAGAAPAKVAFLAALRPKAQAADDLLACLRLATQALWDAARIQAVLGAQPNGQTRAQLRGAIHVALAGQYDKMTQFASWVRVVGLLVEEQYCTITCSASVRLPYGSPTDEVVCTTNRPADRFVVHKHPGAQQASTTHQYASRLHIKPVRGNAQTPRVYQESIPAAIWDRIRGSI